MAWISSVLTVVAIILTGVTIYLRSFAKILPKWTGALISAGAYAMVQLAYESLFGWKCFSELPFWLKIIFFSAIFIYGLRTFIFGCRLAGRKGH